MLLDVLLQALQLRALVPRERGQTLEPPDVHTQSLHNARLVDKLPT